MVKKNTDTQPIMTAQAILTVMWITDMTGHQAGILNRCPQPPQVQKNLCPDSHMTKRESEHQKYPWQATGMNT